MITERKDYLDIAKGIGIILVVLGHCPLVYNPLKQWIYSFHMPLFFLISGLVWNNISHKKKGYFNRRFLASKIKRLIVPCYIWAFIYMIVNVIISKSFSLKKIVYLIYGSQKGFSNAGSLTSLWFLPCMFLAVCFFEVMQTVFRNKDSHSEWGLWLFSIICAVLGVLFPRREIGWFWSFDVALLACAFICWGYLCQKYVDTLIYKKGPAAAVCVGCFVCLILTYRINLRYIPINNADMAGRFLGNPGLYLLDSLSGSLLILLIAQFISFYSRISKVLSCLGSCTIPVFVIHKPIVQGLARYASGLLKGSVSGWIIVIVSSAIAIGISLTVYHIIRKTLPILFGETKS